jgi:hypothetical protein
MKKIKSLKKFMCVLLVAVMMFAIPMSVGAVEITKKNPDTVVKEGDTVELSLKVKDEIPAGISTINLYVIYDSEYVEISSCDFQDKHLTEAVNDMDMNTFDMITFNPNKQQTAVSFILMKGIGSVIEANPGDVILKFNFDVKKDAALSDISIVLSDSRNTEFKAIDGENNVCTESFEIDLGTPNADDDNNDNNDNDVLLGDVNSDGVLDIQDATEIQKYIAQLATFTDEQIKVADVNADNDITIEDATQIQKYLANLITELG